MNQTVVVFGSSSLKEDHPVYQDGILLGAMIARQGWTIMSGGYDGIMGAVSQGASEAGGEAIGITSQSFSFRDGPNPWLTREIPAKNTMERLQALIEKADGAVAMPGNIGTFNEILMVLTLWKARESRLPMILWKDPFQAALTDLCRHELVPEEYLPELHFVNNSGEAMEALKKVLCFPSTLR